MNIRKKETENHVLIIYDCEKRIFQYPETAGEMFCAQFNDRPLWQIMNEDGFATGNSAEQFKSKVEAIAASDDQSVCYEEYFFRSRNENWEWYRAGFICPVPKQSIYIIFTEIRYEKMGEYLEHGFQYDSLTGLLSYDAFVKTAETILDQDEAGVLSGQYAMVYFDVIRFKAINDILGMEEGDRLLQFIANALMKEIDSTDLVCRQGADRFLIFTHVVGEKMEACIERLFSLIPQFDLPFEITCNVGIYVTERERLSVEQMIDRAVLAQSSIKGSYTEKYRYYTEELRNEMLSEQEITGMMGTALAEKHFVIYYQPQYNHSTGMMIGAEALVRWNHPERGLILPGLFIPIFEKNGFIINLDMYVFEEVCIFLRKCMESGWDLFPISVNFSRQSIFQTGFAEKLESIRKKYNIPAELLHVEITEYALVGTGKQTNEVVKKLQRLGYVVEMDDFGSGYSSLNVLKDSNLDIIKLDMMFFSESDEKKRGDIILSSIVHMAKWLGMSVIAEGVETAEQADFLRSIGCEIIQGYLYSKPLSQQNYEKLLENLIVKSEK